jgi:hypothetical protein
MKTRFRRNPFFGRFLNEAFQNSTRVFAKAKAGLKVSVRGNHLSVSAFSNGSLFEFGRSGPLCLGLFLVIFGCNTPGFTQGNGIDVATNGQNRQSDFRTKDISGKPWSNSNSTSSEYSDNVVSSPSANVFYVAPNGTALGNGSMTNPWNLKTALNQTSAVQPGDTIYLRGGTYNVPAVERGFRSFLTGTAANPIKVMSYPGEWAIIDGNLSQSAVKSTVILRIDGAHTWYMNFEITNTEIGTRKIDISGSNPPERRGNAVDDAGMSTKLINLVIHDAGQGIAAANEVSGNEYYGNVVYNNGWDAPDRLHGHGNYIQNGTGSKKLEDNFFFNQFGQNSQIFGSSAAAGRNLVWVGNVFFNGGMSWWGPNITNLVVSENYTYQQLFKLGNNVDSLNTNATIQNNYFMHGVFLDEFAENVTFTNNTIWNGSNDGILRLQVKNFWIPAKFTIDNNTYYKGSINAPWGQMRVDYKGAKARLPIIKRFNGSFAFNRITGSQQAAYAFTRKSWQDDFRFDLNSTYIDAAPTGLRTFLRRNRYDPNRAHIIVYNWNQANTVAVDVSSVLSPGDAYELRNVQDYFGDIQTGSYSGSPITINMTGRTRVKPIGYDNVSTWYHDPLWSGTFPKFGAFVLIKRAP